VLIEDVSLIVDREATPALTPEELVVSATRWDYLHELSHTFTWQGNASSNHLHDLRRRVLQSIAIYITRSGLPTLFTTLV